MYQCDLSTAIQTTHRDSNRGIDQHQVPDEQGQDIPPGVELAPDGEDPPHIVLPTSPFVHLLHELDMTCDVVVGDVWTEVDESQSIKKKKTDTSQHDSTSWIFSRSIIYRREACVLSQQRKYKYIW